MTAKKSDEKGTKGQKDPSVEKALESLEGIVKEMESGSLSLEKMIAHFEEGQSLLEFCSTKLNEVERKIEMLVKKGNKMVAEPFPEAQVLDSGGQTEEDIEGEAQEGELF